MVLLTAVAVAVLSYVLASLRPVTFSADSVLIVPSGAGGSGPGQANEALRLASTYSELIPRDGDLLLAVASALDVPVREVGKRLSVAPVGDTALLRVRYEAPTSAEALLGSRTAADAVIAGVATSDTVPRGSVRLVGLADERSVLVSGGVTRSTVPIGIVLGLALGAVLATAAERANRRIDSAGQVSTVLDVPVFELDTATAAQRDALLRLWRDAGPAGAATVVAVVGTGVRHYDDVVWACERLAEGLPPGRVRLADEDTLDDHAVPGSVLLVPAGALGSGEPNEEATKLAHLVVLLMPLSVRRAVVQRSVSELVTYGSPTPSFVLLTSAALPRRPRRGREVGALSPSRAVPAVGQRASQEPVLPASVGGAGGATAARQPTPVKRRRSDAGRGDAAVG